MKVKMIPQTFVILGTERFKSDLNPLSVEYTDAMDKWAKHYYRRENLVSEHEDWKQMETCKNQILEVLNKTRADAVYSAIADFYTTTSFEEVHRPHISQIRRLLKDVASRVGKDAVRVAAWEFFEDKLDYNDYQSYATKEK